MRYKITFFFKDKPPYQTLLSSNRNKPVAEYQPGVVALSILNLKQDDNNSLESFIERLGIKSFYHNNKHNYHMREKKELFISCLYKERYLLNDFSKNVLLHPSIENPGLEGIPPNKRLAIYLYKTADHENIEERLSRVNILPYVRKESPFVHGNISNLNEKLVHKHNETMELLKSNTKQLKTQEYLSGLLNPGWQYETDDVFALAWLEVFLLAENNIKTKSCRKCNNYFIPWPYNALYCESCRENHDRQQRYRWNKEDKLESEIKKEIERRVKKKIYSTIGISESVSYKELDDFQKQEYHEHEEEIRPDIEEEVRNKLTEEKRKRNRERVQRHRKKKIKGRTLE